MYKRLFLMLLACYTGYLPAQDIATTDWTSFRSRVLQFHPLARQAELYRDQARSALLRARGGFDPKAYGDFSNKTFNDKNYFQYTEAGIKWPTRFGLEIKGNYNLASGDFLNPESKIPKNGQAAFGFTWSLGQGLLFDERRADLGASRIGIQKNEAERAYALNDLLLEAALAYWNWVLAANQIRIYEEVLRQAQIRYAGLQESFRQGDKPAIDTLEAFIQVQNRNLDINFARIDLRNTALETGNFLWTEDGVPGDTALLRQAESLLAGDFKPLDVGGSERLVSQARNSHPALQLYTFKLRELELERRLKQEKRKPVLDLNYQILGNGWQFFPTAGSDGVGMLAQDIKWGVRFSYPILNRKARGDWQLTQVKIAQTDFDLQQKRITVENKVRQYANELNNLAEQIDLYREIAANYRILLDAENEKFRFGESSVFLINTREQRWLDAQVKYLKLAAEYRKTEAKLQWATGDAAR